MIIIAHGIKFRIEKYVYKLGEYLPVAGAEIIWYALRHTTTATTTLKSRI
jgi:hypothetical protein